MGDVDRMRIAAVHYLKSRGYLFRDGEWWEPVDRSVKSPAAQAIAAKAMTGAPIEPWPLPKAPMPAGACANLCDRINELLFDLLPYDVCDAWFPAMEVEGIEGETLVVSFPTKFLMDWVRAHYLDELHKAAAQADNRVQLVKVVRRNAETPQRSSFAR